MGEGECAAFMEILIPTHIEITPPPIVIFNWGGLGGGQLHKRTTPKSLDMQSNYTAI